MRRGGGSASTATGTTAGGDGRTVGRSRKASAVNIVFVMVLAALPSRCGGVGDCAGACVGSVVAKLGLYNSRTSNTGGYLRVSRNTVTADAEYGFAYLYKISAPNGSFYLYDSDWKKFICWNRNFTSPVARRFKKSDGMHLCAFKDTVSNVSRQTHVELHHQTRAHAKLRFNHRGRFATRRFVARCEKRKRARQRNPLWCSSAAFLLTPACDCAGALQDLCCGELRRMPELRAACRHHSCAT